LTAAAESDSPVRIEVASARRPYAVVIGAGVLDRLPALLVDSGLPLAPTIVSSAPIWQLHAERLRGLPTAADPVLMADGERAKNLRSLAGLYDAFAARGVDRSGAIVAFGGGVIGDVAGFAAATYLRGLTYVQVPTTLLAQVDSAIGGKVGINLAAGKNLAGAFHPPALVVVDPTVLGTLPRREFRAGMYEVVKYGVIASPDLFERLTRDLRQIMKRGERSVVPVVAECCRIKAAVVGHDEFEAGPRRVLNFGHTVGHALEAVTRYRRLRHGEAVAYGMLAGAHISVARSLMPADDQARLESLIRSLGPLPGIGDLKAADVIEAMTRDKKRVSGTLHFVLSAGIGRTEISGDVTASEIVPALASIGVLA
jgi:3-dehydroquinate synthase